MQPLTWISGGLCDLLNEQNSLCCAPWSTVLTVYAGSRRLSDGFSTTIALQTHAVVGCVVDCEVAFGD